MPRPRESSHTLANPWRARFNLLLFISFLFTVTARAHEPECAALLIDAHVVALAWNEHNRLAAMTKTADEPLESHIDQPGTDWTYARESQVIPLELIKDAREVTRGAEFEWLPADLRQILVGGGRFVTTADRSRASEFALWMVAPPPAARRGRTGILLRHGRPVVVNDPRLGDEYLIELKGAGLPEGGFARVEAYAAIQGGLGRGDIEVDRARRPSSLRSRGAVRGIYVQTFDGPFGPQDTLFRLTPGNRRASLRGPAQLAESADARAAMLGDVGREVGRLLARRHVAITHPENFVRDRDGGRAWLTDYLDVFRIDDFPRFVEAHYLDELYAVLATTNLVEYVSDYRLERDWRPFWTAVVDTLRHHRAISSVTAAVLKTARDPRSAALGLMMNGWAERVVRHRARRGYDPTADPKIRDIFTPAATKVTSPEDRAFVMEVLATLARVTKNKDMGAHFARVQKEAEGFGRGVMFIDGWISRTDTEWLFKISSNLDLSLGFARHSGLRAFEMVNLLTKSVPGWFELKCHLERENRLLALARLSRPGDPVIEENIAALNERIAHYRSLRPVEMIRMIRDDKTKLRWMFDLPYHHGGRRRTTP